MFALLGITRINKRLKEKWGDIERVYKLNKFLERSVEFDAVKMMAAEARLEEERLRKRVTALEKQLKLMVQYLSFGNGQLVYTKIKNM